MGLFNFGNKNKPESKAQDNGGVIRKNENSNNNTETNKKIDMRAVDILLNHALENMDAKYKLAMYSLVLNCIEKVRIGKK